MKFGLRLLVAIIALVAVFSIPAFIVVDIAEYLWQSYMYLRVLLGTLADVVFVLFLYTARDIRARGKTSGLSGAYLILMGIVYVAAPPLSVAILAYVFSTIPFIFAIGYDIAKKRFQAWVSVIPLLLMVSTVLDPVVPAYFMLTGVLIFALTVFYEMFIPSKAVSAKVQTSKVQVSKSVAPKPDKGLSTSTVPSVPPAKPQQSAATNMGTTAKQTAPVSPSVAQVSQPITQQVITPTKNKNSNKFGYTPQKDTYQSTNRSASFKVIKSWPSQGEYQRSFQNLKFAISDKYADIKAGKILPNPNVKVPGNMVYSSGNYGTIFKMELQNKPFAIKCFTKSSQDIQRRYYEISRYLREIQGKYNIDALKNFEYLNDCVRTLKDPKYYYPVLKMDWIGGSVLNSFIAANMKKQSALRSLAQSFIETSAKLYRLGVSHGDLAGDNILVTPDNRIALIDYDGMYVPAFRGEKAPEKGHEHFQHPDRSINHFNEDLDNFSSLIIYTSLLAVSSKPAIWDKYNKGDYDCLIFRHKDFKEPDTSPIIKELSKENGILGKLSNLIYKAIDHEPLWEQVAPANLLKI